MLSQPPPTMMSPVDVQHVDAATTETLRGGRLSDTLLGAALPDRPRLTAWKLRAALRE